MGVKTASKDSDLENWDKIFKGLVKILRTKQDQLESLVKDRKIIEERIKSQHEKWSFDARNYEEQLSLMSKEIETMKMMQLVETAKCNLFAGLKERDRSLCNLKLEQTLDELDDFKAWFDFLTLNTNNKSCNSKASDDESMEAEIRKLKLEYEKLVSEKKCEVSTLVRENGFAWKQFKCIESGLKKKDDEINQANMKISSLLSYQEQLQSKSNEKDEIISTLKAKVAQMEMNASKKDEEFLKLSQELETLRSSRKHTPVLTRCTTRDNGSNRNMMKSHITTKKEISAASLTPSEQGSKSLKRKRVKKTPVSVSEFPKLFSSSFKVPKLKSPFSGVI